VKSDRHPEIARPAQIEDLRDAVRELTGGKGVDLTFDCVGGELFEPVLSTLAQGGRQIVIASVDTRRVSSDLRDFYHSRLTLIGVDSGVLTVTGVRQASKFDGTAIHRRSSQASEDFQAWIAPGCPRALYSYVNRSGGSKAVLVFD
jgi:NADPH:quinone reductase-like Zn-dependent oxidoreductase